MSKIEDEDFKDDGCNEPNITALAIWHDNEAELGRRLIKLGERLVGGRGLPAKKPWWLRMLYANHGGGPCAANKVEIPLDTAPPRCNPPAQPKPE